MARDFRLNATCPLALIVGRDVEQSMTHIDYRKNPIKAFPSLCNPLGIT
jgi:hypothetical protein